MGGPGLQGEGRATLRSRDSRRDGVAVTKQRRGMKRDAFVSRRRARIRRECLGIRGPCEPRSSLSLDTTSAKTRS